MTYQVHLTLVSRNAKTGPIPVSTTTFATCPTSCPLQGNGCYAEAGHVGMFWRKVTQGKAGGDWQAFTKAVARLPKGTLWRHNQAGDLPSSDRVHIDADAMAQLVRANRGKRGFTYTHHNVTHIATNAQIVREANNSGFTINLSANNLKHADALADLGIAPVVVVLPQSVQGNQTLATPKGRKVVVCPATYREDVTCATCGLCARLRDAIVGFPAHGVSKAKASKVANG